MPAKGLHSGGYSEVTAAKMAKVELPPTVRCGDCNRIKSTEQYSKKQLSDLRYKIMMFGKNLGTASNKGSIRCRACTGQQTMEMTCIICDTTKGLEGFTKAQRRDPDRARCILCVEDILAVEPGLEDVPGSDRSSDSNPYSDTEDTTLELNSLSLAQMDIQDGGIGNSTNFDFGAGRSGTPQPYNGRDVSTSTSNPQQWADLASTAGTESEVGPAGTVWISQNVQGKQRKGTTFTGYDPSGVPHARYRAPSTVASDSFDPPASRSGFARPNGGPRFPKAAKGNLAKIQQRAEDLSKKNQVVTAHDEDEDDDDDDEDFFTL